MSRKIQSENAESPIVVTVSGIVTDCSIVQPLKALLPILSTFEGISNAVSFSQPLKKPKKQQSKNLARFMFIIHQTAQSMAKGHITRTAKASSLFKQINQTEVMT